MIIERKLCSWATWKRLEPAALLHSTLTYYTERRKTKTFLRAVFALFCAARNSEARKKWVEG
jgi:hypothetical protein